MFITPAWAQDAVDLGTDVAEEGNILMSMLPLLLILLVFYVMVFRPQGKRIQEHRDLIDNLKKGDRVVTGGGLIGKVHKLTGTDEVIIDLSDGVRVHAVRSTIMTIREKAVSTKEYVANDSGSSKASKKTLKKASKKTLKEDKTITVSKARGKKKKV